MPTTPTGGSGAAEQSDGRAETRDYVPSIDMQDVLRQLIVDEVCAGNLTKSRRRRIVRYAASMGLNAVQAGRLIDECRSEASAGDAPVDPYRGLRMVQPPASRVPESFGLWSAVAMAIIADILILLWVVG